MANNWKRQTTKPQEPSLSYKNQRAKIRRAGSIERNISKELLRRNISLTDIKTESYLQDTFHTHYTEDQPIPDSNERLRRSMIAEKILENGIGEKSSFIRSQVDSFTRSHLENPTYTRKMRPESNPPK